MKIYLLVSEDSYVYGYRTEPLEADYVYEYEHNYATNEEFNEFYLEKLGSLYFKNNQLIVGIDKELITRKITELKIKLGESDWKVIVNSELIQNGLQPKYLNLHEERQALRNQINELEFQISMMG
jgi:hypothetical protein